MARTKTTVRRLPRKTFIPVPGHWKQKHTDQKTEKCTLQDKETHTRKKTTGSQKKWASQEKNECITKNYFLYRKKKAPILIKN